MAHAVADVIIRQSEAAALILEEQIVANNLTKESVRAAALTFVETICGLLDDRNAGLNKVAAALRAGEGIMPPVSSPMKIDPQAVVDQAAPLMVRGKPWPEDEETLESTDEPDMKP